MKKHVLTTLMLLLFVVGSISTSLGFKIKSEDGGMVIPVTRQGNVEMVFIVPKKHTKNNLNLSQPLEIKIHSGEMLIQSFQTTRLKIDLPELDLGIGDTYSITIRVGNQTFSKSAMW